MPTVEWKRFDVMSVAKIYAAIGAIIGFLQGLFFALFAFALGGLFGAFIPGAGQQAFAGGIAAIIFLPILYAIGGFLFGAILAFIYNVIAARIGGVRVET